ncbi:50S ribosomal protein L11 methyltransferase [Deinococcus yavapaiensis]|uniref:Ribosomal protein L11 methyltransferase n=1 Tax=Deinococcus yavapaiensis KR-236 TaxID=694435 RepID=A0A318SB41_9DEIO|nr:50S ribosomal protein L11 methyltransferase [Deinococcus yavapaiensis]PYE54421.1 [LSU ribosomal protein L11P]-lysine N-methyltransferase [Deinococcus yavapaiensis KR-236]
MWVFVLKRENASHEADLDVLWDFGATGLEEGEREVRAYFERRVDLPLIGEWQQAEERDWQAEWKASLRPVEAGRITIVPPWLRGEVPEGRLALVIDIGMAFGTGHHETTRMAVEELGRTDLAGKRVLDVGTGSGVLAIAAMRLGASEALGVDLDPVTIPAARENARANGLDPDGLTLRFVEGTLSDVRAAPFDVIVANLYAELHDMLMNQYRDVIVASGSLLLTGILTSKLDVVLAALARQGFSHVDTRTDGDWALVAARA